MPEDAKSPEKRHDLPPVERDTAPHEDAPAIAETAHTENAEAQMRRALGLMGARRDAEPNRSAPVVPPRPAARFSPGHGPAGHKRRFVQDGEVPVTILQGRREHAADAPQSRLEGAEIARAQEQAQREKAERALAEANATLHDLRTKLGHANLARSELQTALQRHQAIITALQAELREMSERAGTAAAAQSRAEDRITVFEAEYTAACEARLEAEKRLYVATEAQQVAQERVRDFDLSSNGPVGLPARHSRRVPKPGIASKPRPSHTRSVRLSDEPEPVQWWLLPEKKIRRK